MNATVRNKREEYVKSGLLKLGSYLKELLQNLYNSRRDEMVQMILTGDFKVSST